MAVKNGDTVVIKYEGKLESGEVFDSSEKHDRPLEFTCGSGMVIPGFDEAVIGMEKGQKKEFEIPPEKAYGEVKEELKREVPKSSIPNPEGQEFKEGMVLMASGSEGQKFPVKITGVRDDLIEIDLNHPLAGKKLIFSIELADVKSAE
jgi:FKBP-type peptidyl-prolyl cis-trans isomerase 2